MAEIVKDKERIENALIKVALGYQLAEVTEEYAEVDGELKLTKRKKTKKDVPPDLKAVQLLLLEKDEGYSVLSDEELEREKERLLKLLKTQEKEDKKGTVGDRKAKTVRKKKAVKKTKTAVKP